MCEVRVDDFSLLNSRLPDASVAILGSDSGFIKGNAEAVHDIVGSLLRNDQIVHTTGGVAREQVIPIKISGPHSAARAAMAAKVHLALQNPLQVTIIPCDGWGAQAWWRIQYADMEYVGDDFNEKFNGFIRYNITLGVDAWAKATEKHMVTGSNAVAPSVIYNWATTDSTGWAAENGTLDSGASYVGVNSDAVSATNDTLKKASLTWSPTGFTKITVECKVNPAAGLDSGSGTLYPSVQVLNGSDSWSAAATALVSREDLGSGWYAETLFLADGLPATINGLGIRAMGGARPDQDLKVRKVTLVAGSTFTSGMGTLFFDIPGSAPSATDITVSDIGNGLLLHTAPNLPEVIDGTVEGTYAVVCDMTGTSGSMTDLLWSVSDGTTVVQNGSVHLNDYPYNARTGWVTIAHVYLPPAPGAPKTVTVTGVGATFSGQVLLLWIKNPLTGYEASYTIIEAGTDVLQIVAPTPARPAFSYLIDGVQINSRIRAKGDPVFEPGVQRLFVAYAGGSAPATVEVTAELYPAFHTEVPPKVRWFS